MKTKLTLVVFFFSIIAFSQAPDKLTYQAVVRDVNQNILSNQNIGVDIKLRQSTSTGTIAYQETHNASTNINGLLTLVIGGGTSTDDFSTIDWSQGPYFIETSYDVSGGTDYTLSSTLQLLSVPYALHAKTATHLQGGNTNTQGSNNQTLIYATNGF